MYNNKSIDKSRAYSICMINYTTVFEYNTVWEYIDYCLPFMHRIKMCSLITEINQTCKKQRTTNSDTYIDMSNEPHDVRSLISKFKIYDEKCLEQNTPTVLKYKIQQRTKQLVESQREIDSTSVWNKIFNELTENGENPVIFELHINKKRQTYISTILMCIQCGNYIDMPELCKQIQCMCTNYKYYTKYINDTWNYYKCIQENTVHTDYAKSLDYRIQSFNKWNTDNQCVYEPLHFEYSDSDNEPSFPDNEPSFPRTESYISTISSQSDIIQYDSEIDEPFI